MLHQCDEKKKDTNRWW